LFHKPIDRFPGIIDAESQDYEIIRREFLLQFLQGRQLFTTRGTPSRPEIDQHDLSAEIEKSMLSPGSIPASEIGGEIALDNRPL
jgi:hypothetical protein